MTSEPFQPSLDFEAALAASASGEALILDLDGFEGPLDVLLALARRQKVDLMKISITALAEQYLAFVREAKARSFSLAAYYLVMAAWLAYLKSRLLLPRRERAKEEEAAPEAAAEALAFRLARLDALRRAAEALKALPQSGRELFVRGDAEAIRVTSRDRVETSLYDLITAYVSARTRAERTSYAPERRAEAYSLAEARERLGHLTAGLSRWTGLTALAPAPSGGGPARASLLASTFAASLELVKDRRLEARQLEAFAELYLRGRVPATVGEEG